MKISAKRMITIGLFTALLAIGAFIKVPFYPVSFTMQTFVAVMAGMILGAKDGAIAVAIYIIIGLAGVPIFTTGGGPMYVFQPTFGYLPGMILAALVSGVLYKKAGGKFMKVLLSGIAGMLLIYATGVPYLYLMLNYYIGKTTTFAGVLSAGFLAYVVGDTLTVVLAALVAPKLSKIYNKNNALQST